MADLIDLVTSQAHASADVSLRREVAAHITALLASAGAGKRSSLQRAEQAVRLDPAHAFSFDATGVATLAADGKTWCAGRFQTLSVGELRSRIATSPLNAPTKGRVRLWMLDGASPATDIGSLQAGSNTCTLFQVASQFNCLEAPGPYVTPVSNYFTDSTQGPRASVSAFPATLLRHYAAPGPDGERFVQKTDGRQINLLAEVLGPSACRNGYFTGEKVMDRDAVTTALTDRFDLIRVGVHDEAQVVLGYDWDGGVGDSASRRIAQVFTSTVAGGGYGGKHALGAAFPVVCRQLLRAAYLGTLLAAVSLGRTRVVLTLIGGGVFGNPQELILEAIEWAIGEIEPLLEMDLEVVVNGYNLGSMVNIDDDVLPLVRNRGGAVARFDRVGLVDVQR